MEIKESLYFYELDLMLAAYTASLELLAAAALLHATLKSRADLLKARAAVEHYVENLLADLNKFRFPWTFNTLWTGSYRARRRASAGAWRFTGR